MTRMKKENGKRTKSSSDGSARKQKLTGLDKDLSGCINDVISGTVLAIDPSSGSTNSQPGYAIYQAGRLVDSGLVRIHSGDHISNRLHRLATTLRTEFIKPDILVTENIPPFMGEGPGASFATRNVISLHQSIGVIMSIWDVPVVQVSPRTWRSKIPDNYLKSDENDAIMLGWTAINRGRELVGMQSIELSDRLLIKLQKGSWE